LRAKAIEQVCIFQEELPALREKDLKAVGIDDLLVDFYLRKVRVEGQVQVEAGGYADLGVSPDAGTEVRISVFFKVLVIAASIRKE
jgi:hypothetical protein